jgi:hypothetical protein
MEQGLTSENSSDQFNANSVLNIKYVDYSEYYMVYGIVSLVCVMLLLWYFVRTNMFGTSSVCSGSNHPHHLSYRLEGLHVAPTASLPDSIGIANKSVNEFTDTGYKFGPLPKGEIGDVTVYFNETSDNAYADQWREVDGGLYVHNSKTFFKDTNTPAEAPFWLQQAARFAAVSDQIPDDN